MTFSRLVDHRVDLCTHFHLFTFKIFTRLVYLVGYRCESYLEFGTMCLQHDDIGSINLLQITSSDLLFKITILLSTVQLSSLDTSRMVSKSEIRLQRSACVAHKNRNYISHFFYFNKKNHLWTHVMNIWFYDQIKWSRGLSFPLVC